MDIQALRQGLPLPKLPFITPDLPGIGGTIKQTPAHFAVEEVPLYEPQDSGRHLYLRLRREGWTTRGVVGELAGIFAVNPSEIGLAGLKDKQAVVTQTFSLPLEELTPQEAADRLAGTPFTLLEARRHRNKLKRGHLLGNRFSIVVSDPAEGAVDAAGQVAQALAGRGLPNFFGSQRFGSEGDNAARGRAILEGKGSRRGWLAELMQSAYQGLLFNVWLAERIERGWFDRLLVGDWAKKTDTGGMFQVEDAEVDTARLAAGELTPTGPIYGHRTRLAQGEPGRLEAEVLESAGLGEREFKRARLKGSRRAARLLINHIAISPDEEGLRLEFFMPKGAYATVLLREFQKAETELKE
jgi:tRNA pseudouridine13 synthase